jgi:hypothetical protein
MTDEKRPEASLSPNTRGGGYPFDDDYSSTSQLARRVDRNREAILSLESKIGEIERKVDVVSVQQTSLSSDVGKVLRFINGNGTPEKGWAHRGLVLEANFAVVSRMVWIVVGIVASGSVLGIGRLIYDAIQRGVL